MLTASFLHSGMSDLFSGYGCNDNQTLLYAFYGPRTTLREIVDILVSETWCGPASQVVPKELDDDEVRAAILDCLTEQGWADYASGAISDFAEEYAHANCLDECRMCGASLGDPHESDCAFLAEWGQDEGTVEVEDCKEDDDCMESPVVIFLLEWED